MSPSRTYRRSLAHASDGAPHGSGIQTSGGLLLLFGIEAIVGPALAGAGEWATPRVRLRSLTVANRAGMKKAMVALARKLAVVLHVQRG